MPLLVERTRTEEAAPAAATNGRTGPRFGALRSSETAHAVMLAAAAMAANVIAVAFTVIFTRILGADRYGSLAALLNLTIVLLVPGSTLQVATARESTISRLGRKTELSTTLHRWSRELLILLTALTVTAILARKPLAALLNIDQK